MVAGITGRPQHGIGLIRIVVPIVLEVTFLFQTQKRSLSMLWEELVLSIIIQPLQ